MYFVSWDFTSSYPKSKKTRATWTALTHSTEADPVRAKKTEHPICDRIVNNAWPPRNLLGTNKHLSISISNFRFASVKPLPDSLRTSSFFTTRKSHHWSNRCDPCHRSSGLSGLQSWSQKSFPFCQEHPLQDPISRSGKPIHWMIRKEH